MTDTASRRRPLRVRGVDDTGVSLVTAVDTPVDVCFDGRRIWTFWTRRDTEAPSAPSWAGDAAKAWPVRVAHWPRPLRQHLHGRSQVTVRDSVTGRVYLDETVSLGTVTSTGTDPAPILVRNKRGVDLGIDKSGRLVPTFAGRSDRDIAALLDATEAVIGALRSAGIDPFIAYGTLLGAVREGKVLGHDSDADLGYVSRFTTPVDVMRESFQVQRHLAAEGWRITRYSGGAFKIYVTEADVTRGLDVFAGFLDEGRLHLMGEVSTPFEPEWIHPLGVAHLDGRPMPVPARPEKLLEATYGPGWRVPDPAYKFTTPRRTVRAFDDWFRGTQPNIRYWDRRSHHGQHRPLPDRPTALARRAHVVAEKLGADVLDVGAGRGSDSLWLARQGHSVTAYDYAPYALEPAKALADAESLDLDVRRLNLAELRAVLGEGTRLAHQPRPRVVLARHVVDATSGVGRDALARLCSMALRDGGQLLAEFYLPGQGGQSWMVGRPDADAFTALLEKAGARRVIVRHRRRSSGREYVRVVGVW
ncbi:bifunctional 2-polyprenyl-6-hydroxyphenol methylase/3-demethylubiquinol 3-O-methyltransferase UbiG [Nocardioides sp.]|uniref:class I SAM-dependent methyltransferase n=1 Tax=Nocardioides sp. TaxID=35761 RepID=UPI0027262443|nr:methyltransferase domain-containing protein [Nocardioides sp.]MDO9456138.1 methyltransferase domain-containing protein [Nocardioides sp.]